MRTVIPNNAPRLLGGLALLVTVSSTACSASNAHRADLAGSGGSGGTGTGSSGGGGASAIASDGFDAGTSSDALTDAGACAAESKKAEQRPLDMYIMLDQSASMTDPVSGGGTKWDAVTSALKTFLQQPGTSGIGVGIQYFPLVDGGAACSPTCSSGSDCASFGPCIFGVCVGCLVSSGSDSCVSADYATPDVEIDALPGARTALIKSLDNHTPMSSTPTSAALQGAIDHAQAWGVQHPDHVVIDVLATDGDPTECDTDLDNINAVAAAGASGVPTILTFVIGVGSSLSALDGVAAAGGTGSALLVDTNQNVTTQFLEALNTIRGAALSCSYLIPVPTTGMPDFDSVNVQYTPGGGAAEILPKVASEASCPPSGDAWFYDDNAKPTQILLCDRTCTRVSADGGGQIDVLLGCATIIQ